MRVYMERNNSTWGCHIKSGTVTRASGYGKFKWIAKAKAISRFKEWEKSEQNQLYEVTRFGFKQASDAQQAAEVLSG